MIAGALAALLDNLPDTPGAPCTQGDWHGHADSAKLRAQAAQLCRACPFAATCLSEAQRRGERLGVWGGVDLETEYRRRYYPERTRKPAACATFSGYKAHKARGEDACEACHAAMLTAGAQARQRAREARALAASPAGKRAARNAARDAQRATTGTTPTRAALARLTA